jgi:peptide/nickel transport system substrate-binding protein
VLSTIKSLPNLKVEEAPVGQVLVAYVARRDAAGGDKLLADPVLRRAVALSIDQKEYVEGVLDNNAKVVETVNPPEVLGTHASLTKGVPFDPAEANKLLDQAGWAKSPDGTRSKDGKPLQLTLVSSPGSGGTGIDLSTLEWFQAQLKDVGIVGKIDQVDEGGYRDRLKTGNYDLDFSGPNQNDANPAFLLSLRWYSKATGDNVKIIAPGPTTEFEALIDKSQEATEFPELQRLAGEAMRELVDDEIGAIPLAGVYRIYAMKKTVQGMKAHPSSTNQRWSSVFLSK